MNVNCTFRHLNTIRDEELKAVVDAFEITCKNVIFPTGFMRIDFAYK